MKNGEKTKDQLLEELKELRRQISNLKKFDEKNKRQVKSKEKGIDGVQSYLDIAGVIIVALNTIGEVILINRKGCEVLGYKEEEIIGKNWFTDFIPERLINVVKPVSELLLSGELEPADYYENPIVTREGEERLISWRNTIIRDDDGKIIGHLSSGEDITERKKTEEKLQYQAKLVESVSDAIISFDMDFNILSWNKAAEEMYGWKSKEVIGKNLKDVAPIEFINGNRDEILNQFFKTGFWKGEGIQCRKDGKPLNILFSFTIIKDASDRQVGIVTANRNITERKKAENALRESEGRIKSILRAAPIGIGVVANRVILQVNRRMCEMVGYSEAELVGKDSRMIYESDDDYNHVGKVKYDQIKKKGTGTVETRFKRKDGKVIEVLISSTPLDLNDLSAGITFTALDITERKRIEQERERLNQKLLKKNKELEQIIYATSHDLRSPLVNIQGFSKELNYSVDELISDLSVNDIPKNIKKKISNILEQEIPESMKFIGDSITKMDLLLSGLLRLSRIGREEIHLERLDMTELISSVVNNFEFLIKEKNIRVEIDRLPECMGDKSQINQVFSNLLDNAIKYLKNDISGVIEFSGFKKKDQIVYCVEDNGIGISGNDHEKIFGFFYQADPDTSLGEGLGLTIVNRIIERHNGKVWVESQAGKGSKFCVSLPNI